MEFIIFMMVMCLLIPLCIIIFGAYFRKNAPKKINYTYGYRTPMSVKSKETWEFAHRYFGNLWYKWGWISLIITIIVMLMSLGKDEESIGILVVIVTVFQSILMVGVILPTEIALRKNFDDEGKRKV